MCGLCKMLGNNEQLDKPQRKAVGQMYSTGTTVRQLVDDWQITDAVVMQRCRLAALGQILRCLTMNTVDHHDTKLEPDSFRKVKTMSFRVEKP